MVLLLLLLLLKWGEKKPKSGGELKSLNLLERGTQKNIGGTQPSQKVERTNPNIAMDLQNYAAALMALDRTEKGRKTGKLAAEMTTRCLGEDHPTRKALSKALERGMNDPRHLSDIMFVKLIIMSTR